MFYLRRMYHEERLGPFNNDEEAQAFIDKKKELDPLWDYEEVLRERE